MSNNNNGITDFLEHYSAISTKLNEINDFSRSNIVLNYRKKLDKLVKDEKRTLKLLKNNITDQEIELIAQDLSKFPTRINEIESAINGTEDDTLKKLTLQVNQLYREIQTKYISIKFEKVNKKLDDQITETENSTSSIMFNVISIFLGISITNAMITGFDKMKPEFVIFYFFSCAWIALTILTVGALYFKKLDKKTVIILIIYSIVTTLLITIGIYSYKEYDKNNNKEITEQREQIQTELVE